MASEPLNCPKRAIQKDLDPDPVIEAYKRDVDRTLLRENLRLTVEERFLQLTEFQEFVDELHRAKHVRLGR